MAKRQKDWERLDRPFPNSRRGNLYVYQSHAWDHFSGRCDSLAGRLPNPPPRREMACPLCGVQKGFNDFDEEHCPQRSCQSSFGRASCVVLTCKKCNNESGGTYESRAADLQRGKKPSDGAVAHGAIDAGGSFRLLGRADSNLIATDQKTAFLVAFATLGYHFAFGPALAPVRQSILTGSTPPVGGPVDVDHLDRFTPETVQEHAMGWIHVVGQGYGWMLPAGSDPKFDSIGESTRARIYSWPETHNIGRAQDIERHLAAGDLFHADFCTEPLREHHPGLT